MDGIMVCDKFTVEAEIFEGIEFRGLLYKKKSWEFIFLDVVTIKYDIPLG